MLVLVYFVRRFIRTTINFFRQKTENSIKKLSALAEKADPLIRFSKSVIGSTKSKIARYIAEIIKTAQFKRVHKFFRRYATQTSFGLVIAVFLTVTVGEGQAFNVDTPKVAAQIELQNEGFVGKAQLFGGQTILTGEIQQIAAIFYTVEKGDSITSIANRYDLSVGTILDANKIKPIDSEKIQPGEELIIPAEDTDTSLAWLESLNKAKAEEARLAEEARQRSLASSFSRSGGSSFTSYSNYRIIGTDWGRYGGAIPGQCTSYVNKIFTLPGRMGNGNQYLASARAYGMATGSVPRYWSIIQTDESWWGHVGVVVGVSSTTVTIRDMNFAGPGIITERYLDRDDPRIRGYIYP